MASRQGRYNVMYTDNPAMTIIAGAFQLNSTSNPDVTVGNGFTVTRAGTGKFTVTFDETFPGVYSITATPGLATAAANQDRKVHLDPVDFTAAISSFVCYHSVTTTDTDTDNAQIHFIACLRNSNNTR